MIDRGGVLGRARKFFSGLNGGLGTVVESMILSQEAAAGPSSKFRRSISPDRSSPLRRVLIRAESDGLQGCATSTISKRRLFASVALNLFERREQALQEASPGRPFLLR
jgi:hypothetical protein